MHFKDNGLNLGDIEHLLITHVHDDHYCPNLFSTRGTDFAPVLGCEKLHVYGNADVERLFDGYYKLFPIREEIRKNIVFHTLTPFQSERIGGYAVTPLRANHAPEQVALNYIIDDGKSALLYLLDGGYPTDETLAFIKRGSCRFANLNIMPLTLILHFFQDCNTRNAFSRFPPKLPAFFPVFRTDCTLPWPFCQGKISRFVQKSLNPTPKSEYCPIGIPYGSIYI